MDRVRDYMYYADNDYLYATGTFEQCSYDYNVPAYLLSQAGEKYMKAVVEVLPKTAESLSMLRSHNLRALFNYISKYEQLPVSSMECKWLGDFYYDARYPGDDTVVVSREDVVQCIDIAKKLRNFSKDIISKLSANPSAGIKENMVQFADKRGISYESLCNEVSRAMPSLLKTGNTEHDAISYWEKWISERKSV